MRMKILGVFFVVLVAQAHIAQGALSFGNVSSGLTNIVSTGINLLNTTVNGVTNATITTANTIGAGVNTTIGVITNTVSAGATRLNNTINSIQNVMANLTSTVQNTNISSGLTDATNNAIDTVLTTISDDVAGLKTVSEAVADKVLNVVSAIPDVFYNLVQEIQNATNVVIPKVELLDNIQQILNTSGIVITNQIIAAIDAGIDDLSSVAIPLTGAGAQAINDILAIIGNAPEIFNNIAAILEKTIAATTAAIASNLKNIVNLLSGLATSCGHSLGNADQVLIDKTTNNTISCVTTEIDAIKNYLKQYSDLATKLKAEIAAGVTSGSTVEAILSLIAASAINAEVSMYRLPLCESIQAVNTASNIPALISTALSNCVG